MNIDEIEKSFYESKNSSLFCIVTEASKLCLFYASYLQKKVPDTKVAVWLSISTFYEI